MSFFSYMEDPPSAIVWKMPVFAGAPATMEEALAGAKAPWEKEGWLRDQMQDQLDFKIAEDLGRSLLKRWN